MTNAELIQQIKAEIERLNNKMDDRDPLAPNQKAGYLFALADVLSFLSTLESENPMEQEGLEEEQTCKGFEKEFHQFIKKEKEEEPDGSLPCYGDYGIYRIARHFAQWGAEQILREVEQWVEKNTCRYIDTQNDGEGYLTDVFLENSFVDDLEERMKEILAQWGAEHARE